MQHCDILTCKICGSLFYDSKCDEQDGLLEYSKHDYDACDACNKLAKAQKPLFVPKQCS